MPSILTEIHRYGTLAEPDNRDAVFYIALEDSLLTAGLYNKENGDWRWMRAWELSTGGMEALPGETNMPPELPNPKSAHKKMLLHPRQSMLVPEAVYDDNAREKYMALQFRTDSHLRIMHQYLPGLQAHLLYALPQAFYFHLTARWPSFRISCDMGCWLEYHHKQAKSAEAYAALHISKEWFYLAMWHEGKLKIYNVYEWENALDVLYFLMAVAQQLQIDAFNTPLLISGSAARRTGLPETLKEHWPNATVAESAPGLPPHQAHTAPLFYTMYTDAVCEL